MRMFDIIKHKRDGLELTEEEIAFFTGSIKDKDRQQLVSDVKEGKA